MLQVIDTNILSWQDNREKELFMTLNSNFFATFVSHTRIIYCSIAFGYSTSLISRFL